MAESDLIPKDESMYRKKFAIIKTDTDKKKCCINSICEAKNCKLFILDSANKKVKLLDHTYDVLNEIELDLKPFSMCGIDPTDCRLVAVTAEGLKAPNKWAVVFIREKADQLEMIHTAWLNHMCRGIACNGNRLYITSGCELYCGNVDVTQLRTMLADKGGAKIITEERSLCAVNNVIKTTSTTTSTTQTTTASSTTTAAIETTSTKTSTTQTTTVPSTTTAVIVPSFSFTSCAVSKDGATLYVVNQVKNQLTMVYGDGLRKTSSRVGKYGWTYEKWKVDPGLHMTDSGLLLGCGGKKKDAIFLFNRDGDTVRELGRREFTGVERPRSIYYSENTGSIIIGLWKNDILCVFTKRV